MEHTYKGKLNIEATEEWNGLFWAYNLPLQMWPNNDNSGWSVVNYMPRKESCRHLDELVSKEELPKFCKNTATVLRNLADLFEMLGRGEINHIYYPDETPAEAIAKKEEEEKETEQT